VLHTVSQTCCITKERLQVERVSSYGAQPLALPIVTGIRAVWETGSAWYTSSTEGGVVQLQIEHEWEQNVNRLVAAIN